VLDITDQEGYICEVIILTTASQNPTSQDTTMANTTQVKNPTPEELFMQARRLKVTQKKLAVRHRVSQSAICKAIHDHPGMGDLRSRVIKSLGHYQSVADNSK